MKVYFINLAVLAVLLMVDSTMLTYHTNLSYLED